MGQQHPGDENFVRRPDTSEHRQHYMPPEVARSQMHIPRHYPRNGEGQGNENRTAPQLPDTETDSRQRQTRFFK